MHTSEWNPNVDFELQLSTHQRIDAVELADCMCGARCTVRLYLTTAWLQHAGCPEVVQRWLWFDQLVILVLTNESYRQSETFRLCPFAMTLLLVAGGMANASRAKICTTEAVGYTCMNGCNDRLHLEPRYCLPNLLHLLADCSQACLAFMSKIAWQQQLLCLNPAA